MHSTSTRHGGVKPYYSLAAYMRQRFGCRVQKIPLDANFSCPNRDGTISRQGCLFCNARGSGSGLGAQGLDLAGQWGHWQEIYLRRHKNPRFIAYLQSFSNTHGPLSKLREVLEELHPLINNGEMAGIAVGTRPDCLDDEKLALLASFPVEEVWLELGLQSADDAVLKAINRGHDSDCFSRACRAAANHGLRVCAHLMAGLPQEEEEGLQGSVQLVNALPVHGVKFHNVYVCEGSSLAALWRAGKYTPIERSVYVRQLGMALATMRSDMVVQRLTGDPAPGELLAPEWAADKRILLAEIHNFMHNNTTWQGKMCDAPDAPPSWFDQAEELPQSLRPS